MAEHNRDAADFEHQIRGMFAQGNATNNFQPRPDIAGESGGPRQMHHRPPPARRRETPVDNGSPQTQPVPNNRQGPNTQSRPIPQPRLSQRQRRMHPQTQNGQPPLPPDPPDQYSQQRPPSQYPHPIDPNAFQRRGQVAGYYQQPQGSPRQLFNPNAPRAPYMVSRSEQHARQEEHLEALASAEVTKVAMGQQERDDKEAFRERLQEVIDGVCASDSGRLLKVSLEAFGSFRSGFANAGSDMDLVIVLPDGTPFTASFGLLEDDLPRALEKKLLQLGYGARLLTRTRVPIIKICEKPNECLLDKLRQERERWDDLPNEKKYPHLHPEGEAEDDEDVAETAAGADSEPKPHATGPPAMPSVGIENTATSLDNELADGLAEISLKEGRDGDVIKVEQDPPQQTNGKQQSNDRPRRDDRPFTRERKSGPLDFPKDGVGIQSDINFFNPLGLHNTQLLRCYSLCDSRVKPMVLFVKSWAKRRKINSSYSGTLSSYGYVLMVLHYLINVAHPAVLPNLQSPWRPNPQATPMGAQRVDCDGWAVDFWREEEEITEALRAGQMSANQESLGSLLVGFFNYYSSMAPGPQFVWKQHVLSLRSPGGILSKDEKGWVKAVTEEGEGKKVQHRYLLCIEDPFELSHNVARTVTHMGIVAIRDEFRRARRVLMAVGMGQLSHEGGLFDELVEVEPALPTSPLVDGAADTALGKSLGTTDLVNGGSPQNHASFNAQKRGGMNGPRSKHHIPPATPLNMKDDSAFPALGAAKSKSIRGPKMPKQSDMSEVSGDRARAIVEEAKRKKAEAAAELTAKGMAEAVLSD